MCQKHWSRWFRHGNPEVAKRPWAETEKSPYCAWGHDKRVVGVNKSGACKACCSRHAREQHRGRSRRERPIPNLKEIRKVHRLSQKEFATLAGLHVNTVWALENRPGREARPDTQEKVIRAVMKLKARSRPKGTVLRVAKELIAA